MQFTGYQLAQLPWVKSGRAGRVVCRVGRHLEEESSECCKGDHGDASSSVEGVGTRDRSRGAGSRARAGSTAGTAGRSGGGQRDTCASRVDRTRRSVSVTRGDEVGAGNSGLVGKVNDKAAVLDRGIGAKVERTELVVEGELVGVRRDLAILAAQIADLAGLGSVLVTHRILATDVGVKVSLSGSAVAVARDSGLVNVER